MIRFADSDFAATGRLTIRLSAGKCLDAKMDPKSNRKRQNCRSHLHFSHPNPFADRYKKFFGDATGKRFAFKNGLDADALRHLERIKVLGV